MRGPGRAAILATHNAQWLPSADQIIVLGEDGKIAEKGTFAKLSDSGGWLSKLRVTQSSESRIEGEDGLVKLVGRSKPAANGGPVATGPTVKQIAKSRGAANTSALLYYVKSMGYSAFLIFLAMVLFQTGCRTTQRELLLPDARYHLAPLIIHQVSGSNSGWLLMRNIRTRISGCGSAFMYYWESFASSLWPLRRCECVLLVKFRKRLLTASRYFLVSVIPRSAKGLHFNILKVAFA
jgi:hypothetical protein